MHLSDSRLALGRGGFRFSGLEMIGMKGEKKAEWGVTILFFGLESVHSSPTAFLYFNLDRREGPHDASEHFGNMGPTEF
jgi:hypothetical protein